MCFIGGCLSLSDCICIFASVSECHRHRHHRRRLSLFPVLCSRPPARVAFVSPLTTLVTTNDTTTSTRLPSLIFPFISNLTRYAHSISFRLVQTSTLLPSFHTFGLKAPSPIFPFLPFHPLSPCFFAFHYSAHIPSFSKITPFVRFVDTVVYRLTTTGPAPLSFLR